MILSSFYYDYVLLSASNTRAAVLIQLDFTSLYQINPEHQIVLKYASIALLRQDAGAGDFSDPTSLVRLIGRFNETRNVVATIIDPIRTTQSVVPFDGIAFNHSSPFVAPKDSKILMPPTFQIEFTIGTFNQGAIGDHLEVYFTIGYDLAIRNPNFQR